MARYEDYKDNIHHLVELRGIYDGWSIAVLNDGTMINRWESDDLPGIPAPGYERRYAATQAAIKREEQQSEQLGES